MQYFSETNLLTCYFPMVQVSQVVWWCWHLSWTQWCGTGPSPFPSPTWTTRSRRPRPWATSRCRGPRPRPWSPSSPPRRPRRRTSLRSCRRVRGSLPSVTRTNLYRVCDRKERRQGIIEKKRKKIYKSHFTEVKKSIIFIHIIANIVPHYLH